MLERWIGFGVFIGAFLQVQAMPAISHWKTNNGADVYFSALHSAPLLNVIVQFKAGSVFDGDHPGLASVAGGLIGTGTQALTEREIDNRSDTTGALFDTEVTKLSTRLSLQTLTEVPHMHQALTLFHQGFARFKLYPGKLDRIKKEMRVTIKNAHDNPSKQMQEAIFRALYPGLPLAHPVTGTIASVKAISSDDVLSFYRHYYTANNATVILVGDVSREKAKKIANALTVGLPSGDVQYPEMTVTPKKPIQITVMRDNLAQSYIALTTLTAKADSPTNDALQIANDILGGGFNSKLTDVIRKQHGLAYVANSQLVTLLGDAPFIAVMQAKAGKRAEAIKLANQTIKTFVDQPIAESEISVAKQSLIGGTLLKYLSNAQYANRLASLVASGLPANYDSTYAARINAVTQKTIENAAKQYLSPQKLNTIIVGKAKDRA